MNKEIVLVKRDQSGKVVAIVVKLGTNIEVYECSAISFDELETVLA